MAVKLEFSGDASKLIAAYQKIEQHEKILIANNQTLAKEAEKANAASQKALEKAQQAALKTKEATEEAKKLGTENTKLTKENERLADRLKRTSTVQEDMFSKGLIGARGMVAGYFSMAAAINVVSEAIQHQKQVSHEALTASERIARAQRSVMLNMPGASKADVSGVDARIRAAAGRSRAPDLAAFYESVAASSAATGGNIDAAIRGTEATVPFTRLAPADLPVISSAALEIGKAAGSSDYERSIGMLLQIGGVTRQPNTADFARSLPESLVAGAGTSTNKIAGMESAAELYATLSNATGDVTGRQTSTAVANLVVKMEKFFQAKGNDPGTHDARIAMLQADPALRSEFLGGLGGEVVYSVPIRQMFTPGSDIAKQLDVNRQAINYGTASGMYGATVGNVTGGTPELQAAEIQAQFAGQVEGYLGTPGMSAQANAGAIVSNALRKANPDSISWAFGGFGPELSYNLGVGVGADPFASGRATLEDQIAGRQRFGEPDTATQKQIDLLQQAVEALNRLEQSQRSSASSTITREE